MCGRFAMDATTDEEIGDFVSATGRRPEEWTPSWNIRITDDIPILVETVAADGAPVRHLEFARWSLTPSRSKTLEVRGSTFNARSERLLSAPTWKEPARRHRAIVLARGWYEWAKDADGGKRPHWIHDPDGTLLGFAGLYNWWADPAKAKDDDSRWHLTATIVTTDAPPELASVHDRSPLVLPRDWWGDWIAAGTIGDESLVDAAVAASIACRMEHWEIGPVRGNGPESTDPLPART